MDEQTRLLVAVQSLYDHTITILDSIPPSHLEDSGVESLRNIAEVILSLVQELQEEDTHA